MSRTLLAADVRRNGASPGGDDGLLVDHLMTVQGHAELGEGASAGVLGVAEKENLARPGGVVEVYPGVVVLSSRSAGCRRRRDCHLRGRRRPCR
jgi:hypothetical protein